MRSSLRRILIFIIMVGSGMVLILFDFPLLFIIALVAAIGFLLLVLLSPGDTSELKLSLLNLDKISFAGKQKSKKTYIKIADQKGAEPQPTIEFKVEKLEVPKKKSTDKGKVQNHNLGSIASSFKSIGTILRTGKKPNKPKTGERDTGPDKPAREKANVSALTQAAELEMQTQKAGEAQAVGQKGGSAGPGPSSPRVDDPFLSLSGDELESGLLDTGEEEDRAGTAAKPETPAPDPFPPYVPGSSGVMIGESDIPIPPQAVPTEVMAEVQEEALSNEPDLEEFSNFEGADTIDQSLAELDTIDLDSVELNDDTWEEEPVTESPASAPIPEAMTPAPETQDATGGGVSVGSLPKVQGSGQRAGDHSDMTVFTAPVSEDDIVVRSIAIDIKIAKKAKDVSLLRELRDYRVPAKKIEEELSELYAALNAISDNKSKIKPH